MPYPPLSKFFLKKFYSHRGIALLTTLFVLALLAIFMAEFSFETKIETRGIQNYQASFKSKNAVKSMFKAVIEGLEKHDEIKFFKEYVRRLLLMGNKDYEISFLNPPKPVRLPKGTIDDFPEVSFYTPMISPIDHLFNLNRIQTPPYRATNPETKTDIRLANRFINILKKWKIKKQQLGKIRVSYNAKLNDVEILQIYASIFDWLDKDSLTYDSSIYGTLGAENNSYMNSEQKIEIKNGFLDILSEIKIIRGIAEKQIEFNQWESEFTTYPVGEKYDSLENFSEIKPRINVNLATHEEIKKFLEQFDQNTAYFINYSEKNFEDRYALDYFEKRDEIVKELTKKPRLKLNSEEIKIRLSNITPYDSKSDEYFIPYSFWYKIFLKAEIDNVQSEIKAVVSVDRNINSGKVTKLIVHHFLLN